MTPEQILFMFEEHVHSVEVRPGPVRDYLVKEGYIDWFPPVFGSNNQYCITEAGKEYREIFRVKS